MPFTLFPTAVVQLSLMRNSFPQLPLTRMSSPPRTNNIHFLSPSLSLSSCTAHYESPDHAQLTSTDMAYVSTGGSIGVRIVISDPEESVLAHTEANTSGELNFTSLTAGVHHICIVCNTTQWFSPYRRLRFKLELRRLSSPQAQPSASQRQCDSDLAEAAGGRGKGKGGDRQGGKSCGSGGGDDGSTADEEKEKPRELTDEEKYTRVRQLYQLLQEVRAEQRYMRQREVEHRNTDESTNGRVKWWSFTKTCLVLLLGWLRTRYFAQFLQADSEEAEENENAAEVSGD